MKRRIFIFVLLLVLTGNIMPAQTRQNYVIGFYNLENLFDTYNDPVKNDEEFLPDGKNQWTEVKYQKKLHNMATVIAEMAAANKAFHTILGVSEIENRLVLEDLISQPELLPANFQIVHYDGPDRRGVDVGLLYRADQFEYLGSESIPFSFEGTEVPITLSKEEQDYFRTRDILMVHGLIAGEHFAFYVAHLPSRIGGKGADLRSLGGEILHRHRHIAVHVRFIIVPVFKIKGYPDISLCPGDIFFILQKDFIKSCGLIDSVATPVCYIFIRRNRSSHNIKSVT